MTTETLNRAKEIEECINDYTHLQSIVLCEAPVYDVSFRFVTKFGNITDAGRGSMDIDINDLFSIDEISERISRRIAELQNELANL